MLKRAKVEGAPLRSKHTLITDGYGSLSTCISGEFLPRGTNPRTGESAGCRRDLPVYDAAFITDYLDFEDKAQRCICIEEFVILPSRLHG